MKIKFQKKIDVWYIVRTAVCVVAFLAAALYFAHVCGVVAGNYLILFSPELKTIISWFGSFVLSVILFIIMVGVTAALVRPTWIAMIAYAVSALLYILFVGANTATWIVAAVSVVILILYLLLEVHLFSNQIKASTHPLGEKKMLICLLLALLIAVSIGVGYNNDSLKRNYVIPPELKTTISIYMLNAATTQVNAQEGIKDEQKKTAIESVKKTVDESVVKLEDGAKPYQKYIAIFLGVMAFSLFQIILIFVGIIAMIFVPLLFWILKLTHFTNIETEKCEVTRLTLKSKE
ncbi:MAG: hypothetical protein WC806_05915 [Candidatus Gracilibacteria bacterium]|jgi:hypothetical protein